MEPPLVVVCFSLLLSSVIALSSPRLFPTLITPVGPFAIARSPACAFGSDMDNRVTNVMSSEGVSGPSNFMVELQRMSAEFSINNQPPDPERVGEIVSSMEESLASYKDLLARLSMSPDFQQREYYAMTVAQLRRKGQTIDDLHECVDWQIESMRAYSESRPPPTPSPKIMEIISGQEKSGQSGGMGGGMPNSMTPPFLGTEACFNDKNLLATLQSLQRDHDLVINMGKDYGYFDPLGKIAFIDQIEKIEERWGSLLTKLNLMSEVNDNFKSETERFLDSMGGLSVRDFYEVLSDAHDYMRARAEDARK